MSRLKIVRRTKEGFLCLRQSSRILLLAFLLSGATLSLQGQTLIDELHGVRGPAPLPTYPIETVSVAAPQSSPQSPMGFSMMTLWRWEWFWLWY